MEASDRYGSLVDEYRGIFKLAEDAAAIKTSAEIYVAEQSA